MCLGFDKRLFKSPCVRRLILGNDHLLFLLMFNTVSQHFGIMAAFPLCTLPEGEFVPRIQTDFGKMMLY